MKLMQWIVGIAFITASFDNFLVFQVGGSLRPAQIMMLLLGFGAMARIFQEGRVLWPRGATALSLWLLGQLLCVPLSGVLSIGLQFFVTLLLYSFAILAMVQIYGLSDMIRPLMKLYLVSFLLISLYGLLQFFVPLFTGVIVPYTSQWFLHGRIARINGFSYEPSYFATYIVMGWIMMVELRISKARITEGRFWKWATILVTAALLLSSSKAGWVVMLVEALARLFPKARDYVRHTLHHSRQGRWLVRLPGAIFFRSVAVLIVILVALSLVVQKLPNPLILIAGTGLGNTPAHSYVDRNRQATVTFEAFKDSPFVGRSLGGVPIYLARRQGIEVSKVTDIRIYWGFPVLLEVLVASGLIGFIPFLVFLYTITFGAMRFATRYWPQERAKWLRALARAMIFEWMMLMSDQNLLRVSLWLHFAMVIVVAYHLEFAPAEFAERMPQPQTFSMLEVPAAL